MIAVYGLVALVALVYFWFRKKYSFWESHGFPTIPGKFPFGSVSGMGISVHSSDMLKKFYDQHKETSPAFGLYFMTQPVLIPTDPELVKDILVRHFESFHDRGFYFNEKDDPLSGHLV
jgi:cytochrome P450 family 6